MSKRWVFHLKETIPLNHDGFSLAVNVIVRQLERKYIPLSRNRYSCVVAYSITFRAIFISLLLYFSSFWTRHPEYKYGKLGETQNCEKKSEMRGINSEFWVLKLKLKHQFWEANRFRPVTVVTMVTDVRLRVNVSWRGFRSPCAETPRHQMSDDEVKDTQDGDDWRINERSRKHLNDPTSLMLVQS